jgi:hypothetical protein
VNSCGRCSALASKCRTGPAGNEPAKPTTRRSKASSKKREPSFIESDDDDSFELRATAESMTALSQKVLVPLWLATNSRDKRARRAAIGCLKAQGWKSLLMDVSAEKFREYEMVGQDALSTEPDLWPGCSTDDEEDEDEPVAGSSGLSRLEKDAETLAEDSQMDMESD